LEVFLREKNKMAEYKVELSELLSDSEIAGSGVKVKDCEAEVFVWDKNEAEIVLTLGVNLKEYLSYQSGVDDVAEIDNVSTLVKEDGDIDVQIEYLSELEREDDGEERINNLINIFVKDLVKIIKEND